MIFDGNDLIDLVPRWACGTHDIRVLRESGITVRLEPVMVSGQNVYLLDDSGYPCKKWILIPYLHPAACQKQHTTCKE